MANAQSKHPDKDRHGASDPADHASSKHKKHIDTGEHAKKNATERAHVADEGLGMSKFDSTRKS
jgi:hypothetical protein